MAQANRAPVVLFFMRVTVFLVMFMWTIDKFINPAHAQAIFAKFYNIGLGGFSYSHELLYLIAGLEVALLVGFLFGLKKTITYGLVLVFHGVSTLSAYQQYFSPFTGSHLLFFAAWPMLAACFALFYLRDQDKWLTFKAHS